MDLRQLAALVAVADNGTFSAAAAALHTVQSNVSAHIARLERELGVTLVDRAAGRLTEEGHAVAERSRRVQAELAAMVADVQSLRSDIRGTVRLGVIGSTGRWLVPALMECVEERHPGIRLTVAEGTTSSLEPRLESGDIDLAIVTLPAGPDLQVTRLFDEELLLVVPVDHPLAGRDRVSMTELDGLQLLLPAAGTVFRKEVDEAAAAAGVSLRARAELDGVRMLASITFEGIAPGIVPASAIPAWLPAVRWRPLEVDGLPRRQIGLAGRARALPSAPARAMSAVIHDVVSRRAGEQPGITVTVGT